MIVETHVIQNFAPSNLNRDDTGAPKDCMFGGYRRARISSQCIKRSMREAFRELGLVDHASLAVRTRRLHEALTDRLEAIGRDRESAEAVAEAAVEATGLNFDKAGKTQYLVFVGQDEIDRLAALSNDHWDELSKVAAENKKVKDKAAVENKNGDDETSAENEKPDVRTTAAERRKAKKKVDDKTGRLFTAALMDGSRAVDLALFGRMIADRPEAGLDGSAQVAHAISTHAVATEFDFYTAIDDLNPAETAGAGMMGTVEFNSACFYRYANLNADALQRNLGDAALTCDAVRAWLNAAVHAVPRGKQNSMAAYNPPSLVLTVVRGHGHWSLANAFVRPVRAEAANGDLVAASCDALGKHWSELAAMYGREGIAGSWVSSVDGRNTDSLDATVMNVPGLIDAVVAAVAAR